MRMWLTYNKTGPTVGSELRATHEIVSERQDDSNPTKPCFLNSALPWRVEVEFSAGEQMEDLEKAWQFFNQYKDATIKQLKSNAFPQIYEDGVAASKTNKRGPGMPFRVSFRFARKITLPEHTG